MRDRLDLIKKYCPWLFMVLGMNAEFCLLFWIADVQSFKILLFTILTCSLLFFAVILAVVMHREIKRQEAVKSFLEAPAEMNEQNILTLFCKADRNIIRQLGETLRKEKYRQEELRLRVIDYEEYVEAWAHETKTPISLLTLLLDNHGDEMPDNIANKMDYIRNRMQEYVDQMLFYARLKSEKNDLFFEQVSLDECVQEILEDYQPLLEEKNFTVTLEALEADVFSDKRGLRFILSQIISNSVKYSRKDAAPSLEIRYQIYGTESVLSIADNGIGVRKCDLPYIFEKGFTGDSGENRKKATGMGLYLVHEFAKQLKLELDVESKWMQGFVLKIKFPNV